MGRRFENDGSQSFTERVIATTADYPRSVHAADVTGNGGHLRCDYEHPPGRAKITSRGVAEYESNAGGLDVVSPLWDDNQVALYPAARRKPPQEAFRNRSRRTGRIPQVRDGLRPPIEGAHALPGAHDRGAEPRPVVGSHAGACAEIHVPGPLSFVRRRFRDARRGETERVRRRGRRLMYT